MLPQVQNNDALLLAHVDLLYNQVTYMQNQATFL